MHSSLFIILNLIAVILAASRIHKKHEEKEQKIKEDRDDFDEELLWHGDEEEEGDDSEDYDDWHPDELDPDVRTERFAKLIKKMDANSDNKISREELVGWTLRALQNMDARELSDDFELADADHDGKVSWEEYVENIYGLPKSIIEGYTTEDLNNNEELKDFNRLFNREYAKFMAADANEDGFLNTEEYELFYNPGKEPKSTEFAINEALKNVDKNKDGKIDETEFLEDGKVPNPDLDDEEERENLEEIFDQLDLNSDKFLSGFELTLWIQQDNGEIAADETDHLMSEADSDEDGYLSYDEVHNAMEEFIESDATEYGYMLKHDEL